MAIMPELSEKEIEQRLIKLRNLERLHPIARQRIELLEKKNEELKKTATAQGKLIKLQAEVIEKLKLRIEELEKMVFGKKKKDKNVTCLNQKRNWFKRKKPRGADTYRRAIPKEADITDRNDYPIAHCPDCGTPLQDLKWIVRYLEDIKLFEQSLKRIEKQRIATGYCPCCQKRASGMPISSQTVGLGDNIRQFVCYCAVVLSLSFEKTKHLIKDLADIEISDGEISRILEGQANLLTPQYHQLAANIRAGPAANYDETGWKVQKGEQGRYGWVMAAAQTTDTVFRLGQSRGRGNALKLKGKAKNQIAITDDYGAYKNTFRYHQLCWAHPIRKLKDLVDSDQLSDKKLQQCQKAYRALAKLHQSLKDVLAQPFEVSQREKIKQKMIKRLFEIAQACPDDPTKLQNIKQGLIKNQEKYFTCLMFQGVPTTNNRAERALRHLVLKRKSSFGSKTQKGAWIMSVLCSTLLSLWWSKPDNFFKEYSKLLNYAYVQ